jgi:hypothetical protein
MAHLLPLTGTGAANGPSAGAVVVALTTGAVVGLAAEPGARVAAGLHAGAPSLPPAGVSLGAAPSLAFPMGAADPASLVGAMAALGTALNPDQHPLAGLLPHGPRSELVVAGGPISPASGPSPTPLPLRSNSCCGDAVPRRASPPVQPLRDPMSSLPPPPPVDLISTGHRHRYHKCSRGGFPRARCDPRPATRARHERRSHPQMATAQRLLLGQPPVAPEIPPTTPEAPLATGLDADHIAALHAQAVGLHNIRSLVSIVLDPASSHYPRWRGRVLLTLRRYALDDVLDDIVASLSSAWSLMDTVVLSWLHGIITIEFQDIIHD